MPTPWTPCIAVDDDGVSFPSFLFNRVFAENSQKIGFFLLLFLKERAVFLTLVLATDVARV